jgi:hypothetical protein
MRLSFLLRDTFCKVSPLVCKTGESWYSASLTYCGFSLKISTLPEAKNDVQVLAEVERNWTGSRMLKASVSCGRFPPMNQSGMLRGPFAFFFFSGPLLVLLCPLYHSINGALATFRRVERQALRCEGLSPRLPFRSPVAGPCHGGSGTCYATHDFHRKAPEP